MKKYKTLLFDLDGTIIDSGRGIINSVIYAMKKFGVDATNDDLNVFLGPPLTESFMKYYKLTEKQADIAVDYYREYYRDRGIKEISLYKGMDCVLRKLKERGYKLIIATSKPEIYARQIIETLGLSDVFDFVAGAEMGKEGGSKANIRIKKNDVINYAFEMTDVNDLSDAIMIGDRNQDVFGAKSVGIDSVGVLYGYGSLNELSLAGADYIATTTESLLEIF